MNNIAETFKALGDQNRLEILSLLSDSELCVCEVMAKMDMSQSTASHHLKVLKNLNLIKSRKAGKWIFYCVDKESVEGLQLKVDEIFASLAIEPDKRDPKR
ncbi:ArsR/SmtB family transcription factor [Natranaerobius trueperi]|uniref:Transcriptional regulator n=1 Tax=Natranaerobius trueperi TaxID=759412 RepID=A0A226BYX2_9FIRM|nr:metalloregulator ArsR/SmtB family transcription factor [Natranaerobius trueperi]OWZ83330.1 transcriptional regulator [Natranaerobius trueperi]